MSAAGAWGRREGCARCPGSTVLGVGAAAACPAEWKGALAARAAPGEAIPERASVSRISSGVSGVSLIGQTCVP